jgi:hypothetical protein
VDLSPDAFALSRPEPNPTRLMPGLQALGLLVFVAVLASMPAYIAWETWSARQAVAAAWTIKGPPCAVVQRLSRTAFSPSRKLKSFHYNGATFTRAFGAASCVALDEPGIWSETVYPVCQFNNPGFVAISSGGEKVLYQPPVGRRATVEVHDGRASCVVGGWFNL